MTNPSFKESILYHDAESCPLGSLYLIVTVKDAPGVVPTRPLRIYGHYATVFITRGHGTYSDANGYCGEVREGDIIFVFPELGHVYAPAAGTAWDEVYTVFDGVAFDMLRECGYLDPSRPVRRGLGSEEWLARLGEVASISAGDRALGIVRFVELLTLVAGQGSGRAAAASPAPWASRACNLLAANLETTPGVDSFAARMNMTGDSFRRRFKAEVGFSPIEYRLRKKMELACILLRSTTMPHAKIAQRLGFSDEYHFSKQFRERMGMPPKAYRHGQSDRAPNQ
ncbi:MAG TPA: AraC family transcriptional regulator [Capsulimonadaceae bacterium]|jgi:AraC-like DNA-binding protein